MNLSRNVVLKLLVLCVATGCSGDGGTDIVTPAPPPPPPPQQGPPAELAGTWTFSESFAVANQQSYCGNRGLYILVGTGTVQSGSVRQVGTCVTAGSRRNNSAQAPLLNYAAHGDSIRFRVQHPTPGPACDYRGRLSGSPFAAADGIVSCANGATGTWQATRGNAQALPMGELAFIETGAFSTCAANTAGQTFCWGLNHYGQLAVGDDVGRFIPAAAAPGTLFTAVSLSPAGAFGCGLAADGTAHCWGSAQGGRLGSGTIPPSGVEMLPQPVAGGLKFRSIAAGGDHACGVTPGGAAYCWGNNGSGQLGTGGKDRSLTPVPVQGGLAFATITAHVLITCGVTTSGAGYCWGDGLSGALGNGTLTDTPVPTPVSGSLSFTAISLGTWAACGVTTVGEGYCWGDNSDGQLGGGSRGGVQASPQKVAGGLTWRMIDMGTGFACGISTNGRGYCWGYNGTGELGIGAPGSNSPLPVPLAGNLTLTSISADWHACAADVQGFATAGQLELKVPSVTGAFKTLLNRARSGSRSQPADRVLHVTSVVAHFSRSRETAGARILQMEDIWL